MHTFLCEDSIAGIFSGIYEAWAGGYNRQEVVLQTGDVHNYELFMEYKRIAVNMDHGEKVGRTILQRFGDETYERICLAMWSDQEDKANAIYQTIVLGIEKKFGHNLIEHLSNPYIRRVFELSRKVGNEAHHYLGFVRFSELKQGQGILYAEITPKSYIIERLAPHFEDRLPMENWLIYDKTNHVFAVHQAGKAWVLVNDQQISGDMLKQISEREDAYENLWKHFCKHISIKERENLRLQRQNLPLRFRGNMTEFK